jgi:hypothetical protein
MSEKPQKGGHLPLRRIYAAVPEDVYKALRHHAVEADVEIQTVVTEALRKYLGLKGGEKEKK